MSYVLCAAFWFLAGFWFAYRDQLRLIREFRDGLRDLRQKYQLQQETLDLATLKAIDGEPFSDDEIEVFAKADLLRDTDPDVQRRILLVGWVLRAFREHLNDTRHVAAFQTHDREGRA